MPQHDRGLVCEADVEKIGLHLNSGACGVGYVIVVEECDWEFAESFAADAEANHHGCRVRFIRSERAPVELIPTTGT